MLYKGVSIFLELGEQVVMSRTTAATATATTTAASSLYCQILDGWLPTRQLGPCFKKCVQGHLMIFSLLSL